jgi:hypothetical protein
MNKKPANWWHFIALIASRCFAFSNTLRSLILTNIQLSIWHEIIQKSTFFVICDIYGKCFPLLLKKCRQKEIYCAVLFRLPDSGFMAYNDNTNLYVTGGGI